MNVRRKTQTTVTVRRGHPRRHRLKMPAAPTIRFDRHRMHYQVVTIPTQPDNISLWLGSASAIHLRPQDQTNQFTSSLNKIQSLLNRPLKSINTTEFEGIARALAQLTWVLHHYETELYDGIIPVESIQQAQITIKAFYRKLMNFVRLLSRRLDKKAYRDEHRIFSKAFHLRKLLQEFYQKDVYVVADFEYPLIALAIKGLIRNQITIEQNPKPSSTNSHRHWIHQKTPNLQLLAYLNVQEPSDDQQPRSIWIDKMTTEFEDMHYDYPDRAKIDADLGRNLLTERLNYFYDNEPDFYKTLRLLIDQIEDLEHKPHLVQKAIYYILRSLIYCKDVDELKKYLQFFYDQQESFDNIRPAISAFSAQYYCFVHFDHYNFGTNSELDVIQQFVKKPGIRVVKIGKRYPIEDGVQEIDVVIEIEDPDTGQTHLCLVEIKSSKLNFGDAQAGRYHSVAPEGSAVIFISPKFKKPEFGTPGEGQVLHLSPRHIFLKGAGYLSQLLRQI